MQTHMESEAGRISGLAIQESGSWHFSSTLGGSSIPLPLQSIDWPLENYQVALVPLGDKVDRAAATEMKPVLMLPMTWRELVVHLRSQIHPSGLPQESQFVRFGEVSADFSNMEVSRAEKHVALTAMELKLLRFLVQNAGRAVSRNEMLDEVWGYQNYPSTRTVDNHILRLRQKLESDPANPVHFRTVHRVGYRFVFADSRIASEHKM